MVFVVETMASSDDVPRRDQGPAAKSLRWIGRRDKSDLVAERTHRCRLDDRSAHYPSIRRLADALGVVHDD
jgi:hypothetical protein